jgi:peptidoglycan/xylan/chitin deacetylase (PgdA/CDA1 family)
MKALRRVATGLANSGLPALAWRARRRRAGRALVLMYHRVAPAAEYGELCVPPAIFDRQLELLRTRACVLPLRALVERLATGEPLPDDIAAITFDDGYRDNLDVALPILQRHALPATIFVTTGFVDGTVRPASARLWTALTALWRRGINSAVWPERTQADQLVRAALAAPGAHTRVAKLQAHLKRLPTDEGERLLAAIERLADRRADRDDRMLDWDAVRHLANQGIEIGSHTVAHPILSRLPIDQAEQELRDSKGRLEAAIGKPVLGFAFPNGHAADFGPEHIGLLRRLGYAYACSARRGVNRPASDPFCLRRIGVGADSRALLDLKLAIGGPVQPAAA